MDWLDPGVLVDRELELVAPHERWVDDVLAAVRHPMTQAQDQGVASWTRATVADFLRTAPGGRDAGDIARQRYPGYHFWMRLRPSPGRPPPGVRFAGGVSLRVGRDFDLKMYLGHVGYHVFPPARGNHYAERSVRLLLPLAKRHGMTELWVTTNPENVPSRRTCERLGCRLIETVDLPPQNILYQRGERRKCRYLLRI
jgi:RimJ/RimL family protein N-acetyltransferase